MIETIGKYVEDKSILAVARALLKDFSPTQQRMQIRPLKLSSIEIANIGNIGGHNEDYGQATLVMGPRGSGKSWYMEAPLWILTGSSKTKDVAGDKGEDAWGALKLNIDGTKYSMMRKQGKKTGVEFRNLDDDDSVSKAVHETAKALREALGLDIDLISSTLWYSPRFSFQFSRSQPHQIEELVIRCLNLDEWLELELHTKRIREAEAQKIIELDSVITYVTKRGQTRTQIEAQIEALKKSKTALESDIKKIAVPDVKDLSREYNDAQAAVRAYEALAGKIKGCETAESAVRASEGNIAALTDKEVVANARVGQLDYDEQKFAAMNKTVNDLIATGQGLAAMIERTGAMTKTGECPVLHCVCDKLEKRNADIEKEVVRLTAEKRKVGEDYKAKKKELDDLAAIRTERQVAVNNLAEIRKRIEIEQEDLGHVKKIAQREDIAALRKQLSEMQPLSVLNGAVSRLSDEISKLQKTIKEKQVERERMIRESSKIEAQMEACNKDIEELKKVKQYEDERNALAERQAAMDVLIPIFGKKGIPKSEARNGARRLTRRMNAILELTSNHTLKVELDEEFIMNVRVKGVEKDITIATVSDGQENLINMAFALALAQEMSPKGKVPLFVADDVLRSQGDDDDAKNIIAGLLHMRKSGHIGQLFMSSSMKAMKSFANEADKLITCKGGKLTEK